MNEINIKEEKMINQIAFDIESSGLKYEAKDFKIHVISVYNFQTKKAFSFHSCKLQEGVDYLLHATELIGHNIIDYDIPALERVFKVKFDCKKTDTLLLTRALDFNVKGNGLDQVAVRRGMSKKTSFDYSGDLSQFSISMVEQCERDVEITVAQLNYLKSLPQFELEDKVNDIILEQIRHGVYFDVEKARLLKVELDSKLHNIKIDLQSVFGSTLKGNKLIEFNPGSTKQLAEGLIRKYNWEPINKTPTGLPQLNEATLKTLDYPECKKVLEYNDVEKTISFIDSWLERCDEDSRIHGNVNPLGTVTRRMTHSDPNLSQVPSTRKTHGKACRELFCAPHSKVLVGMDVKGLEACVLAHYAYPYDNGEMIDILLHGSIHDKTAKGLYGDNFTTAQRNIAKSVFFAKVFGAFPKRLAATVGVSENEGKRIYDELNNTYPHLVSLDNDVFKVATANRAIKVIDGSWVRVDFQTSKNNKEYPDAPVNRLVQTTGAILCKRALVIAKELDPKLEFVLNSHDEIICECDIDIANDVVYTLQVSVKKAGEYYNLRIPLEGEVRIGSNWSEVH